MKTAAWVVVLTNLLPVCSTLSAQDHASFSDLQKQTVALLQAGQPNQAIALMRRALDTVQADKGGSHLDVVPYLQSLGALYRVHRQPADAEPYYQRALMICEEHYGERDMRLVQPLNDLATVAQARRRDAKAESLYRRALAIQEMCLGRVHPEVATTLNKLALICKSQGRLEEAEVLYDRALAINEKMPTEGAPESAVSLLNLGTLYLSQGKYDLAESTLDQALALGEKAWSSDSVLMATALNNLASLYVDQGRYQQAERFLERVVTLRETSLGRDPPDVAAAYNNLGSLYVKLNDLDQAERCLREALVILQKSLPSDHPELAQIQCNLGEVCRRQENYTEAEFLGRRALATREKVFDSKPLDVAVSLNNLGILFCEQGKLMASDRCLKRALHIREQAQGPDHPDLAAPLQNLTVLYKARGKYAQAEIFSRRYQAITKKAIEYNSRDLVAEHTEGEFMSMIRSQPAPQAPAKSRSYQAELAMREVDALLETLTKDVVVRFTDTEYKAYPLETEVRRQIQRVDNQEMVSFLLDRGVKPGAVATPNAENLIAYLRYKGYGTEALYAWIDLVKGPPGFSRAIEAWRTIEKERGREFLPRFHLLFYGKLPALEDVERWAVLFKSFYTALPEGESEKRLLLLCCLVAHIQELKEMGPLVADRFSFLSQAYMQQPDPAAALARLLALVEFMIHQSMDQPGQAGLWAERAGSLHLAFVYYMFAKDIENAGRLYRQLEILTPGDQATLAKHRDWLQELEREAAPARSQ